MTGLPRESVTGLVLAGGLGRRMSDDGAGVDKGLRPFRGRPMVAHAIERLAPQVGALIVNANRNVDAYAAFGYRVIGDAVGGFAGPLAGLHAGLLACETDWLVTVPCDSPFLPADLVERLAQGVLREDARLGVARTGTQPHPVFALVARSVLPSLEAFLASGQRKIDAWYAALPVATVDFDDETAFRNINTPAELRQYE